MVRDTASPIVPRLIRAALRFLARRRALLQAPTRAHVPRGPYTMDDSVLIQRQRIVEALKNADAARSAMQCGLIVLPEAQEAAFQALADAGLFNRRHPDLRIAPL